MLVVTLVNFINNDKIHSNMYKQLERYQQLEARIWQNLNKSNLLSEILHRSSHADNIAKYTGVSLFNEFQVNTRLGKNVVWTQIFINHQGPCQPVTPKLYRLAAGASEQQNLCAKIWGGITNDDLLFIADSFATDYHQDKKWINSQQEADIKSFLQAIKRGTVSLELLPKLAQYMFYSH